MARCKNISGAPASAPGDREAEVARAVAVAAEAVEVGGRRGSLWIGFELTTA